jgi:predicted enzyme related to lactoylglutathione lyase
VGAEAGRNNRITTILIVQYNQKSAANLVVVQKPATWDSGADNRKFAGERTMTKKRIGDAWMPADEYGRAMPKFSVNLLVREVERSLPFYKEVLGATVRYADRDFAALNLQGVDFMLHADHTYDHHPLYERLKASGLRGTGAELRVLGINPDVAQRRAEAAGMKILQPSMDFPHGWRDVMLEDPDGYIWAVGVAIP